MEENQIFQEKTNEAIVVGEKKSLDTVSLVLSVVTLVASPFIPLVAYVCGIIGLIFAIRNRKTKKTSLAIIFCIVGLFIAVISHVIGTLIIAGYSQYIN